MMTDNTPRQERTKVIAKTGYAEITSDAPADAIWPVVADVTRTGDWSHECRTAQWLGAATAAVPGAKFRGSNRSGVLLWRRVCEVLSVDPPRELSWRTMPTLLYPDSTEWRIVLQPMGTGTRIVESYRVVQLPPAWLDRLMALVNPSHIDRAPALEGDLRRLSALATRGADTVGPH
jgi:Polyketide cyclase / dehydrase and lipid transport